MMWTQMRFLDLLSRGEGDGCRPGDVPCGAKSHVRNDNFPFNAYLSEDLRQMVPQNPDRVMHSRRYKCISGEKMDQWGSMNTSRAILVMLNLKAGSVYKNPQACMTPAPRAKCALVLSYKQMNNRAVTIRQ